MTSYVFGNEIPSAVNVRTTRTVADQTPITLCQLKSRALPVNPRRNSATARTEAADQTRGIHSTRPLSARNRNAALDTPVIQRPVVRDSPERASQRCQSVFVRKNRRHGDAGSTCAITPPL